MTEKSSSLIAFVKEKNMLWEQCKEIESEIVEMRRELHQIPELGFHLPKTRLCNPKIGRNRSPIHTFGKGQQYRSNDEMCPSGKNTCFSSGYGCSSYPRRNRSFFCFAA